MEISVESFATYYCNIVIETFLESDWYVSVMLLLIAGCITNYITNMQIAPGAFMSINYAMGNSLWLVTPQNTIIVIDSPESTEAATAIRTDMRQIPAIGNKPITFIIYTLFHGDHTFGARVCGNQHLQYYFSFISELVISLFDANSGIGTLLTLLP
jgi:hypothetical protein